MPRSGLPAFWLRGGPAAWLLAPLAALYRWVAVVRRRQLTARARRIDVPVVVVGSIFVGGTGKTPVVDALVAEAQRRGYRPGVILRGYGGAATDWPRDVRADSDPREVGDEAVLLAGRRGVPVVAAPDRPAAARRLVAAHGCDLVIADDGLQHYRLHRDAEVIVLDSRRGLGNGCCLPAGPLREPPSRLREATVVLANGARPPFAADAVFGLVSGGPVPVNAAVRHASPPPAGTRVHAIAGIGDPERFFGALEARGYTVVRHARSDHHAFDAADLRFDDEAPVLMTEKDAVKCRGLDDGRLWCVPVELEPGPGYTEAVARLFEGLAPPRGG